MKYQHKNLAKGKWFKLSFFEQMAHIGSEVERAILWRKKAKNLLEEAKNKVAALIEGEPRQKSFGRKI